MADSGQQGPNIERGVLQAIFAVFLGLMITAVVGVGVNTFHANPADETQEQLNELYEQRAEVEGCGKASEGSCGNPGQLTAAEQAQIAEIDAQIEQLSEASQAQRESWGQSTSVILVVIATALMAVSLLLGGAVTVLSNGILLGGLFTMLYGVGWGLAAGDSVTRFLVLLAALAVSLALGYLKFVRGRQSEPAGGDRAGTPAAPPAGGVAPAATRSSQPPEEAADLAARVTDLERRLAAAAVGLGAGGPGAGGRPTPASDRSGTDGGSSDPTGQA